jgi:hypothetical protein
MRNEKYLEMLLNNPKIAEEKKRKRQYEPGIYRVLYHWDSAIEEVITKGEVDLFDEEPGHIGTITLEGLGFIVKKPKDNPREYIYIKEDTSVVDGMNAAQRRRLYAALKDDRERGIHSSDIPEAARLQELARSYALRTPESLLPEIKSYSSAPKNSL